MKHISNDFSLALVNLFNVVVSCFALPSMAKAAKQAGCDLCGGKRRPFPNEQLLGKRRQVNYNKNSRRFGLCLPTK